MIGEQQVGGGRSVEDYRVVASSPQLHVGLGATDFGRRAISVGDRASLDQVAG